MNKKIKDMAMMILNRNGESGIKRSDFTIKEAKQLIREAQLGWMDEEARRIAIEFEF